MKKLITLLLTAVMAVACCFGLTACGSSEKPYEGIKKVENMADIQIGFICLHDSQSTYDANFIDAIKEAAKSLGIAESNIHFKTGVNESSECYDAAVELIETENCNVIFADSFGHEPYMLQAAKEYPEVQFCHATGTTAHTEKRGNFHNAFASIYEGRYLSGVAAGLKLKAMYDANNSIANNGVIKIGYVGAFTYEEVISGYTSWYLGVKKGFGEVEGISIAMDVQFTGSWYDPALEKNAALALINSGAVLISQHADSLGSPEACADKNVPNVSYNKDTRDLSSDEKIAATYITASRINWAPYFKYVLDCINKGVEIDYNWTGTISTGSVEIISLGAAAVEGTQEVLDNIRAQLVAKTLRVFDVKSFTVNGQHITSYIANVDTDEAFTPDTEVVTTDADTGISYIAESEFRSAPYFGLQIDGITLKNEKF